MSKWYETTKEGLDIDGDEVNILVTTDDSGNVYTTVKICDLQDLLKTLDQEAQEKPCDHSYGSMGRGYTHTCGRCGEKPQQPEKIAEMSYRAVPDYWDKQLIEILGDVFDKLDECARTLNRLTHKD